VDDWVWSKGLLRNDADGRGEESRGRSLPVRSAQKASLAGRRRSGVEVISREPLFACLGIRTVTGDGQRGADESWVAELERKVAARP
jgi:hypothetical protein